MSRKSCFLSFPSYLVGSSQGQKNQKRKEKRPDCNLPSFVDQLCSQKHLIQLRTCIPKRQHSGSQNWDPLSALTFCSPGQLADFSNLFVTPATHHPFQLKPKSPSTAAIQRGVTALSSWRSTETISFLASLQDCFYFWNPLVYVEFIFVKSLRERRM